MKKWLTLALGALWIGGCGFDVNTSGGGGPQIVGSGKISSISRKLGTFKGVSSEGSIDVELTVGPARDAEIKGDDNLIGLVKTEIRGDTLHVFLDKNYSTRHGITVERFAPDVDAAAVAGSGSVTIHHVNGAALKLSIGGSGSMKVDGKTSHLAASVSGSGDLRLFDLHATDADVSIMGSGDADVDVSGKLDASIAGSGSITYHGKPQVTKSIAGSGDVAPG